MAYLIYISKQKFEDYIDLLLITDESKSHCVYIKHFNKFMFNKTKYQYQKHFFLATVNNVLTVKKS